MNMKVKIIARKNNSVLVEYIEGEGEESKRKRVYVPSGSVRTEVSGVITSDMVEYGIPYGLPWAKILSNISLDYEEMENELHRYDVWTIEDLFSKPQEVLAAYQRASGSLAQRIRSIAKEYVETVEKEKSRVSQEEYEEEEFEPIGKEEKENGV